MSEAWGNVIKHNQLITALLKPHQKTSGNGVIISVKYKERSSKIKTIENIFAVIVTKI